MKKSIVCFFIMVLIILGFCETLAYSTSDYSIDIPSSYKKADGNSFISEDGITIEIEELSFSGSSKGVFSEEFLDEIVKEIYSGVESTKEEMKKNIKEAYGDYLTDSQINEYVKSFKCDSIDKKEITFATKNQYKCYHIVAKFSTSNFSYYMEQYSFVSNNKVYMVEIGTYEKSVLQSEEIKNIINSFTILNYKDPEKQSSRWIDSTISYIIMAVIVAIGSTITGLIKRKNKKVKTANDTEEIKIDSKKESIEESFINEEMPQKDKDNLENEVNIEDTENKELGKKHCTKCGITIEEDWDFCNNCGNKLK